MKYVVAPLDQDTSTPYLTAVASNADLGTMLLTIASVGDPFFAFETLPVDITTANDIGANFANAPVVSSDAQANRINVAALYASPPATGDANDGVNVVWKID